MSKSFSSLHHELRRVLEPIRQCLSKTQYMPPEGANVSIKSMLESLLIPLNSDVSEEHQFHNVIKDFALCCAALASSEDSTNQHLAWIPKQLSDMAASSFGVIAKVFCISLDNRNSSKVDEFGMDCSLVFDEKKLVAELLPLVLPSLKSSINESSVDVSEVDNEIFAASARVPVAYAIVAAYQFRWFVSQVGCPHLGKLVSLVIPCALTALDHWSPEVKGQGMISMIHLAKNVNVSDICWYEDAILDACCQNIASSDEIWHLVVEMSVLLVTYIHQNDPRSSWFEKILDEMLCHLERQPGNSERCFAWLEHIDLLFHAVGLILLAHFRRIFPLFFTWLHADEDQMIVLVLKRIHTIIKVTWIRNTPYVERLVDELAVIYKEATLRSGREEIRLLIFQILVLLQQCKGLQFEAAWEKHRDDPNLSGLGPSFCGRNEILPW